MKAYSLLSREFANSFRSKFKIHQDNWENVSTNFGPLTLMEGWTELNKDKIELIILNLAKNFIEIENLIDQTLKAFEN